MKNFLYLMALILIIFWSIGFFVYHTSGIIHILLVIAMVSILLRLIESKK